MKKKSMIVLIIMSSLILMVLVGCNNTDNLKELSEIDGIFNNGKYEQVIVRLNDYLEKHPESYLAWNLLGWAHLKTDELEQSQKCFDKVLRINSEWDNAYVGKGVLYRKLGKNDQARESYLKAINIEPQNAEAFSSLLVIELIEGNDKKAVEYGERAWAIRKDLASIPANLAVAYHYLGDKEKRDEYFKHAKRLNYHSLQAIQDIFEGKTTIR